MRPNLHFKTGYNLTYFDGVALATENLQFSNGFTDINLNGSILLHGGTIGKIRDDDVVTIDSNEGLLSVTSADDDVAARPARSFDVDANHSGMGRELFAAFRSQVSGAEAGASSLGGNS